MTIPLVKEPRSSGDPDESSNQLSSRDDRTDPFVSLGSVEDLTAGVDGMDRDSDGIGYVPRALCPQCGGSGKITPCPKCLGSGYLEGGATCHICDGRGSAKCPRCDGTGNA